MSRAAVSLALAAALLAAPARGAGAEETPTATSTSQGQPLTPALSPAGRGSQSPTPTSTSTPPGEVAIGALAGTLHGVALRGAGFRLGLGGRQPGGWPGRDDSELAALVTAGGFVGRTTAGLAATELRLGAGARARLGRLLLGADAELIQLSVDRASTGGRLRGTGLGARLLVGVQVVRLGPAALFLSLEGVLDTLDPFGSPDYLTAGQLGLGARW